MKLVQFRLAPARSSTLDPPALLSDPLTSSALNFRWRRNDQRPSPALREYRSLYPSQTLA